MKDTLKTLGLSQDELRNIVVNKIVDSMMSDGECEESLQSSIQEEYSKRIKLAVEKLAEETIQPKVERILEETVFQETNRWGESEKPKLTLREYLVNQAEKWVSETVDYSGKPKGTDSFSWTGCQTRLAYMIHKHLQYEIDKSVRAALNDFNSKLAIGIQETVKLKLDEAMKGLQITSSIK